MTLAISNQEYTDELYRQLNGSFLQPDYWKERGREDAHLIWETRTSFSIFEFEKCFPSDDDTNLVTENKLNYFKAFQAEIEGKVPRHYCDLILDSAEKYNYDDFLSEHGNVIVQFSIPSLLKELEELCIEDEEVANHFNPRYGGCSIYNFDQSVGDVHFSYYDLLANTPCIEKAIILGPNDLFKMNK
ncbi:hypothetical protein CD30_17745 [Ureibacillus massiliensis 4400831 = CIP 108448 = CCUG 49529]|uniref:Uncharacterized protein n=1 Tax=Ureibacillus massiliensis 4400831 = CIP 108448 = CCUG 49529 TaxID=1211035 RepID=A0A0A3IW90_9BACL|nr:hypothetical protein [Ureibacillus massiliensis]KGR89054.1 hypothetical protein CD30_17745 [Ureibacillus massiliensis 4400831 = CIP 108448 = CCUG 49529]